jgi:hypothetical protein
MVVGGKEWVRGVVAATSAKQAVSKFNAECPVGTAVSIDAADLGIRLGGDKPRPMQVRTIGLAFVSSDGEAVVFVDGCRSFVSVLKCTKV